MIRAYTYLDIPAAQRAASAGGAQQRLKAVMADPAASAEQRAAAQRQHAVLRQWALGALPVAPLPAEPETKTTEHRVEVADQISVQDR